MIARRLLGMWCVLLVLVGAIGAIGAQDAPENGMVDKITAAFAHAIEGVGSTTFEDDGERVIHIFVEPDEAAYDVIVVYRTVEIDELAYNSELLEMFRALGTAIERETMTISRVQLIPAALIEGETATLETVSAPGELIRLLAANQLSRSDFLQHVVREAGSHGGMEIPGQEV